MGKDFIKAIIKRPGEPAEQITIANTLKAFQKAVGGFIEVYSIYDSDAVIVCNEEGKLDDLEFNFWLFDGFSNEIFVGIVVIVGTDDDEFDNCPITVDEFESKIREDIGAYYCKDCGAFCDEPTTKTVDLESVFGVGSMFPNHHYSKMFGCPFCGSEQIISKGEMFR